MCANSVLQRFLYSFHFVFTCLEDFIVLFATYYLRVHRAYLAVVVRIAPCVVPNTVCFSNR